MNFIDSSKKKYLNCSLCKRVVSQSPVYSNSKSHICGRCNVNTSTKGNTTPYERQYAYEEFVKNIIFPCSYQDKGCTAETQFNKNHEALCKYRSVKCPMLHKEKFNLKQKCKWHGSGMLLKQHVEDAHINFIKKPPFFGSHSQNIIFFTYAADQLFTVIIFWLEKGKYKVSVLTSATPQEQEMYRYQIELYSEDKNESVILRQNTVDSIHNLTNLIKSDKGMFEVDLTSMADVIKHSTYFKGKIGIVKRASKAIPAPVLSISPSDNKNKIMKTEELDERILYELECPVCKDYMIPPIFICTAGHSICSVCKPLVSSCPTCRSLLQDTRNFTLENLTTRVNYPCHNRNIGCHFITTSDKIRTHEVSCKYSGHQCILKCHWRGSIHEMHQHILEKHENVVFNLNKEHTLNLNCPTEEPYLAAVYNKDVFRLAMKYYPGPGLLRLNLQHLNNQEEPMYKYTVEFMDDLKLGVYFKMTYLCQNLSRLPKKQLNECISITKDCLQPFAINDVVFYKITIQKI